MHDSCEADCCRLVWVQFSRPNVYTRAPFDPNGQNLANQSLSHNNYLGILTHGYPRLFCWGGGGGGLLVNGRTRKKAFSPLPHLRHWRRHARTHAARARTHARTHIKHTQTHARTHTRHARTRTHTYARTHTHWRGLKMINIITLPDKAVLSKTNKNKNTCLTRQYTR